MQGDICEGVIHQAPFFNECLFNSIGRKDFGSKDKRYADILKVHINLYMSIVANYDISAHTLSVYQLIQKCFVVIKVSDNRPNLLDCVGSVDI